MRIVFASDHAGFELKKYLLDVVLRLGYEVEDFGAKEYIEDDDYPDYVALAGRAVSSDPLHTKAIVIGGSGQGEAIMANRFRYVRAVVYIGEPQEPREDALDILRLTREHNDSNVLSLGARFLTNEQAERAVTKWLGTVFEGEERHVRRNNKIDMVS